MSNVIGPDVSFYQDDPETPQGINFLKMRGAAEFVIIRAGQNLWPDPDFKFNWRESKKAGFKRGCYWFYDSRADPKRQAESWFSLLEGDPGELPLFADFEDRYDGPFAGWRRWYDFLERLKQLAGRKEIAIYTAYYYWRDHAPNPITQASNLNYFHQYGLWIAHYQTAKPSIPKPWGPKEWLFWQFTESGSGSHYGVESNAVDLNYFNGDHGEFIQRFPEGPSRPAPAPQPKPGPGTRHKVITAILRIREGPATSFAILGRLERDEIVVEITANTDRTWINIHTQDGLIGWVSNDYLIIEEIPVGMPPVPAPVPTGILYRVVIKLKLMEGPGASYNTISMLEPDEEVEEVGATADRRWLQVKRSGGLIGWVLSVHLISMQSAPGPTPHPPAQARLNWHQVTATALTIRDAPAASGKSIGFLLVDDIVPSSETPSNGGWVNIQRVDGLSGWVHGKYITLLGFEQPALIRQNLSKGINYFRKSHTSPRPYVAHVITLDLKASALSFLVTPPTSISGILCTRTVSEFLSERNLYVAINGDGFRYLDPAPTVDHCSEGDSVAPNGFAAGRGRIYSERGEPTIYINRNNSISFNKPIGNIYNAVSGDRMILEKGKLVENLATNLPNPRSAIGLSGNGRSLILAVVDGRQPGYSEGATFPELAALLIYFGAYTGINMDGGGSSALVIQGVDGNPRVLNSPIDENIPGKERPVANHLGIALRK